MPLKRGAGPKTVSSNIREMRAAGYPERRAVAAAMRERDESKHRSGTMKADGSDAMRQHKQMAEGRQIPGQAQNFGAESLHEGRHHQHMDAGNGTDGAQLGESERSAPPPIAHTPKKHPATAHSDHGPHHMAAGRKAY